MEVVVGYMKWKKKPGVTVYTECDSQYVTGKETKIRFFGDPNNTGNYQKINDSVIGKPVQFVFIEGFSGQAQIYDIQIGK